MGPNLKFFSTYLWENAQGSFVMSNQSGPVRNTLLIVGGVLGMLLLFGVVLRAALAPLYQEVAHMQSGGGEGESYSGGGGGSSPGGGGSQTNVNPALGGIGGLLNWALGWAWSGPGWYSAHPGGGWWGGNWWNNWSGSWDRNGNWYDANGNRVGNNDTFNRNTTVNTGNRDDQFRQDRNQFRGDRPTDEAGAFRADRPDFRGGGDNFRTGEEHYDGSRDFRGGGESHGGERR